MSRRNRFLVLAMVGALITASCSYTTNLKLPNEQAISSRILWGDGTLLTRVHGIEDRDPVKLDRMAPVLKEAVIAIEDARYWEHRGFDVRGIIRAVKRNVEQGRVAEGGSTITQQYVRAVLINNRKTLKRKLKEAVMAMQIEERYSKRTILERYLNTVYFGNGAYGVQAAARTYFSKDAADLDLVQSALLAGVIRSPNEYDPFAFPDAALTRRNVVIERMQKLGKITPAESDFAQATPLGAVPLQLLTERRYPAPFFVERVKHFVFNDARFGETVADRERKLFQGGLTIETTLDPKWQAEAERALQGILNDPRDPPGALVAVDPRDGHVKAYAGSQDYWNPLLPYAKVDLADARDTETGQPTRSPGSTFKPFVLAAALRQGIPLTRTYPAPSKVVLRDGNGEPWELENFDGSAGGSARLDLTEATVNSVNTVYGQLGLDVGPASVALEAGALGISTAMEAVPSIAIGSQPTTVYDMASAYGVFAADGVRHPPVTITRITDREGRLLFEAHPTPKQVVTSDVARTISGVLTQVVNRGTGVNARIGRPVAGKTGTADNGTDAWFVGYTPELAAAVWVGFPENTTTRMEPPRTRIRIIGGQFPARIWQLFASGALADVPASEFLRPEGTTTTSTTAPPSTATSQSIPGIYSVIGRNVFDAVRALTEDGFRVELEYAPSRRYSPNYVIAQDPSPGVALRPGARITLTVATGRPRTLVVPSLIDKLSDQAANEIRALGLVANVVVEVEPEPRAPDGGGKVWKQSPSSGKTVDEGSAITIWVNP